MTESFPGHKSMKQEQKIRVKAMCLFVHDGRILVADGKTQIKGKSGNREIVPGDFYRLPGGSINFNETSEDGIRREILEELQSGIDNLKLIDVIENIFDYAGEKNHEVVFLFIGELEKGELYNQEKIHIVEEEYEFDAIWVSLDEALNGKIALYPMANYEDLLAGYL